MNRVIEVTVIILIAVALIPGAITAFVGVDTTTWPDTVALVWNLLPVLGLLGVALGMLYFVRTKSGNA